MLLFSSYFHLFLSSSIVLVFPVSFVFLAIAVGRALISFIPFLPRRPETISSILCTYLDSLSLDA